MSSDHTNFLVIEETSAQRFEYELETAANDGYMVVSSNLVTSRFENEIIYYALMSKKTQREGIRNIPVLDI